MKAGIKLTDLLLALEHVQPPTQGGLPRLWWFVVFQDRFSPVVVFDGFRSRGQ